MEYLEHMDNKLKIGLGVVAVLAIGYYIWSMNQPKPVVTAPVVAATPTTAATTTPVVVAVTTTPAASTTVTASADGSNWAKAEGKFFKPTDTKW